MYNNDLQNIAQKTNDRATQTPLKSGCEFMFTGMVGSSASPLHIVYGLFFIDVPFVIFKLCHADDENLAQSLIGHDCSVGTEYQDTKLK
jgi:hypothetical protein